MGGSLVVDVFISYSRQDLEAVSQLANAIQQAGYEVWWDAELPPHKSYGEVITDKIENANAAIVVWSPTAAESEWVRAEADMARSQKKLIQTALGDIMPPLPFNQIQFADLGDWNGEDDHSGWRKVKESLRDLCGEREPLGAETAAAAVAATPATKAEPAPPPAPTPAPPPAPAPAAAATSAPSGGSPPPGSIEYYRDKKSPLPLIGALAAGAVGLLGGGALLASLFGGDDDYSDDDIPPIALSEPTDMTGSGSMGSDSGSASMPSAPAPMPAPPPQQPSGQTFTTGTQTFDGAIRQGEERAFTVGLNANTSYRIVAECDIDCSDIDMWLYDENGNLIDEDVLEDDYPILDVTPIRSAEFTVRLQMFACSIEPCGFQITVQPL